VGTALHLDKQHYLGEKKVERGEGGEGGEGLKKSRRQVVSVEEQGSWCSELRGDHLQEQESARVNHRDSPSPGWGFGAIVKKKGEATGRSW